MLDAADYTQRIAALFGPLASEVLREYPLAAYPSPSEAFIAVMSDSAFLVGERECEQAMSRFVDVFAYHLDVPDTPVPAAPASFPYRSAHVADLPYLFKNLRAASGAAAVLNQEQARLSKTMVRCWTSFARSGRPEPGAGAPKWEPYRAELDQVYRLRTPAPDVFGGIAQQHHCDFWAALGKKPAARA